MEDLKRRLFAEYKGFADKRIKNLAKSSRFIVDDRSDRDVGADRGLLGYFCSIFADVDSATKVSVLLYGNVPMSDAVNRWVAERGAHMDLNSGAMASLSFSVRPGDEHHLVKLAEAMEAIVAPGAPRYSERSYKYVCPRTGASLRRLARALRDAWKDR